MLAQVVALHDAEFNQLQISKQLNISRCCVQNAINKYSYLGTYEGSKRSGRPKRFDERCFQHLKRLIKGDARLSETKIASDWNTSLQESITTRAVCTYLKELAFEYLAKVQKQWLGVQHRQQRATWCTKYVHWTSDDWKHMIFSDESTFYVLKRKNQWKIWHLEKKNCHRSAYNKRILMMVEKLEFGGNISGIGATNAKIYIENINGELHCGILRNEMKQFLAKTPAQGKMVFEQGLAPRYTSNIIEEKIVKLKLTVLDWAPESSDLNLVEML